MAKKRRIKENLNRLAYGSTANKEGKSEKNMGQIAQRTYRQEPA